MHFRPQSQEQVRNRYIFKPKHNRSPTDLTIQKSQLNKFRLSQPSRKLLTQNAHFKDFVAENRSIDDSDIKTLKSHESGNSPAVPIYSLYVKKSFVYESNSHQQSADLPSPSAISSKSHSKSGPKATIVSSTNDEPPKK